MLRAVYRGGLVDQVIDAIVGEIAAGRWSVGDRLPSVADLAVELDVGRSTVREAVQALSHRGLLAVYQGRGTFVADHGAGESEWVWWLQRAGVLDVYEARRGVEVDAARLAAIRRTEDDVAVLKAAAQDRREARTSGAVSEWAAADLALHRAVFTATHNPVLGRLFDALAQVMVGAFEHQSADPGSTVDTGREHDRLVEAIIAGDPGAAMNATAGYLDSCERDLRRLLASERHPTRAATAPEPR